MLTVIISDKFVTERLPSVSSDLVARNCKDDGEMETVVPQQLITQGMTDIHRK
jgi:hypothetical protein